MSKGGASNEGEGIRKSEERVYKINDYKIEKLRDALTSYFEKEGAKLSEFASNKMLDEDLHGFVDDEDGIIITVAAPSEDGEISPEFLLNAEFDEEHNYFKMSIHEHLTVFDPLPLYELGEKYGTRIE